MFAVLKTGGKQYRVQAGDVLRVERIAAHAGEKIQFNDVLMLGGDSPVVGAPMIEGAGVQAEVIDEIKGDKVIHYVKRRRKHSSQRTKGHRQKLTLIKITDILASGAADTGVKAAIGTGSVKDWSSEAAAAPAQAPKPKAKAKKAKAEVAADADAAPAKKAKKAKAEPAADTAEAPAKPKRAAKKPAAKTEE